MPVCVSVFYRKKYNGKKIFLYFVPGSQLKYLNQGIPSLRLCAMDMLKNNSTV